MYNEAGTSPTSFESLTLEEVGLALRKAVTECSERGLYFATKWAAETLDGLPASSKELLESVKMDMSYSFFTQKDLSTNIDYIENDKYLLGKSYFDVKEFDWAAFVLKRCKSSKCRFLRVILNIWMVRKERGREPGYYWFEQRNTMFMGGNETWHNDGEMNGFLIYLYGLILKQKNPQVKNIKDTFLESVLKYHYNWNAWLELAN
ncbi:39238_t:CDS:2 [Gigaspora margarita]|uniref:39238_t:CDS:1 n=1 Tax=Gigaspora margarita TaxID=4874 RepID=A0ABN7WF70_GIGMA|nr:39238_t:CDS:2 [Gigaspora margarita]